MTRSLPLQGRIAVVTGASAGIGRAVAAGLVWTGANVVINARRREKLDEAAKEIARSHGAGDGSGRLFAVAGDAADESTVTAMLDAARKQFGRDADLVIVNAGRGLSGSPVTSDAAQWEEMIRTNLLGASRLIRAAATRMLELVPTPTAAPAKNTPETDPWLKSPRDIIILGSSVGRNISPFSSMYGSTKFAINSIAEAVRRELSPKGIRVSTINPAVVRSDFQAAAGYDPEKFGAFMDGIGPVLEPEDVARLIIFMASQPAHVCLNDVMIRATRQEYP